MSWEVMGGGARVRSWEVWGVRSWVRGRGGESKGPCEGVDQKARGTRADVRGKA